MIWVIEIKDSGVWMPCADAYLSRSDARRELNSYWRINCPSDKFRVVKYVRESL